MWFCLKVVMFFFLKREKIQTFFSYFLLFNINCEIHRGFWLPPYTHYSRNYHCQLFTLQAANYCKFIKFSFGEDWKYTIALSRGLLKRCPINTICLDILRKQSWRIPVLLKQITLYSRWYKTKRNWLCSFSSILLSSLSSQYSCDFLLFLSVPCFLVTWSDFVALRSHEFKVHYVFYESSHIKMSMMYFYPDQKHLKCT